MIALAVYNMRSPAAYEALKSFNLLQLPYKPIQGPLLTNQVGRYSLSPNSREKRKENLLKERYQYKKYEHRVDA